jgi:multidrug resistance efflux pump
MQTAESVKYKIPSRSLLSNLLICVVSTGLIAWSIQLIQTRFTSVISRDAVINGVLTALKAPSEGIVSELSVKTGDTTSQDKVLLTLKNERVSELQAQEINSKINQQQAELERAKEGLARQLTLLQTLVADQQNQSRLEVLEAQQSVAQVMSDLQIPKARYQLAQLNYKRTKFLVAEGALSQAELDSAALEMQQSQAEMDSLKHRLDALRTNQQASQLGLTLSRNRSNYDPRIRLEELQLQIADRGQAIQILQQSIKDARAELARAKADVQQRQAVVVKAPNSGVVWRLDAQRGTFVERGESLGQVLDCKRRWVDVFVDERAMRSLQPGTPATIELYGSTSKVLHGQVSLVRSGIGRLVAGEDVAIPITPNLPRNTQVRVDLDPATDQGNPHLFCYVGYTGRVTFKLK